MPPNPAELLGSEEMRKLLNILSEQYAHIIIDSPPAISFTDASILSTMVDGVILVVHGGEAREPWCDAPNSNCSTSAHTCLAWC